jgi:hypothetical protein
MFYKLLAADMRHHDFTYKEGLNVDHVQFYPFHQCLPGGLYFTDFKHLPAWYRSSWTLIADVTLPPEAQVYAEPCGTKWKADRLVLSNIRPLSEFLATLDEATVSHFVLENPHMLNRVDNQTEALCMAAVQKNGWVLRYAKPQTEAMCLAAVQQYGCALQFVETQTEAICRAAVQQRPDAQCYVKIPITV